MPIACTRTGGKEGQRFKICVEGRINKISFFKVRFFNLISIHSNEIATAVNIHFEKISRYPPIPGRKLSQSFLHGRKRRQLLMSTVRQFKDNLEISKTISKKSMATGWDFKG